MSNSIRGQRPRPRVGFVGEFSITDIEAFSGIFPTVYFAETIYVLKANVDTRELDVLVIGDGIDEILDFANSCHTICFSEDLWNLPGPINKSYISKSGFAETEEYGFPDIPLSLARRREADFSQVNGIRGLPKIKLNFGRIQYSSGPQVDKERANDILYSGIILIETITSDILSFYFLRDDINLGVAYLPNPNFDRVKWTTLLLMEWSSSDSESLSNFNNWTGDPKWMTSQQLDLQNQLTQLENNKQDAINECDRKISDLDSLIMESDINTNNKERRLITAQGDDLVDEVKNCFQKIGFTTEDVDKKLKKTDLKREDLRLSDPDDQDWNAIVEIRGYTRSSGKTSDLLRLNRFSDMFHQEFNKYPDLRIYVVNGEIELQPNHRNKPLFSAEEDVKIFASSDGLVIWTLDLFGCIYSSKEETLSKLKNKIKQSTGYFSP